MSICERINGSSMRLIEPIPIIVVSNEYLLFLGKNSNFLNSNLTINYRVFLISKYDWLFSINCFLIIAIASTRRIFFRNVGEET